MNLLIKLLIFSFPFIFVAALFWPAIEQKIPLSSHPLIEEKPPLKPSCYTAKLFDSINAWLEGGK